MKGVIFAAGLGTRLYPLTKDRPKALVEVKGLTMLEHTLIKFQKAGIDKIVVNVHAFADKVEEWLKAYSLQNPSLKICVSDERSQLLETGGGLKKMKPLLGGFLQGQKLADEPFLVHNVDILSDIDLKMLFEKDYEFSKVGSDGNFPANGEFNKSQSGFKQTKHLATLAVRITESDRYFLFNQDGILCGWENVKTGEQKISRPDETNLRRFGFTGIHVIHPRLFDLMTEEGVFSITDVYIRLAKDYDIRMVDVSNSAWFDIGSPEQLKNAEENFV